MTTPHVPIIFYTPGYGLISSNAVFLALFLAKWHVSDFFQRPLRSRVVGMGMWR